MVKDDVKAMATGDESAAVVFARCDGAVGPHEFAHAMADAINPHAEGCQPMA